MLTRTKPQEDLGTRKCAKKNTPKEAFRIKGALGNAAQNKNTNNNRKKTKEKALKWTSQTEKEPYKTTLRRTEPIKCSKEQQNH